MKKREMPSVEVIKELLSYNPDTGLLKGEPNIRVGSGGYIYVYILGTNYLGHRLAWLLHYGECKPSITLDHINGVKTDNRICNLRTVTAKKNARNAKQRVDNTSGVTGVRFSARLNKWRAQIALAGKNKHLGMYETIEGATNARKVAEKRYGFHDNHGRVEK